MSTILKPFLIVESSSSLLGVVPNQLFDAFAPASVDASSSLPSTTLAQALKYEGCRRYLLDTIGEDPVKIEHACYRSERAKDDHRRGNAEARERVVPPQRRVSAAGAAG
jgi:hypothetical protein